MGNRTGGGTEEQGARGRRNIGNNHWLELFSMWGQAWLEEGDRRAALLGRTEHTT